MHTTTALTAAIYIVIFASGAALSLIFSPALGVTDAKFNWPDIVSSTVAASAFLLALLTYQNWKQQKVREDAHTTAKTYISTLVNIEETIIEMLAIYEEIIPRPGSLVYPEEYTHQKLMLLRQRHNELSMIALKLMHVHDELAFWGAALTNASDHISAQEAVETYLRHSGLLINSLININFHHIPDNTTSAHATKTYESMTNLFELFKNRKSKKMSNYFKY